MSSLSKIRKNVENYNINQLYNNMTPEDYKNGVRMAVNETIKDLNISYQENINKLKKEYEENLKYSTIYAIDTLSVELLYELAKQLGCFDKEPEFLEDKIYRVKEIYQNTIDSIAKYTKYKTDKQAQKEYDKKKKKVEKMFDIKF